MAIIKQLKSLWGVTGTLREIADVFETPAKRLREAVSIGLPSWDPPEEEPPRPPDQEAVDRVREVIGMGSVEEREAFTRVMGTWRRITTGAPREPVREEIPRQLPAPAPSPPAGAGATSEQGR